MAKKKMTVPDFKWFKETGRKFTFVTAYDYTIASIVDESETEVVLVGDSAAMIMLGRTTTVGMTLDEMIHFIKPVVIGAPNTFVIGDMPFGSYNISAEQAVASANRIVMETRCDAVKLEGGKDYADTVARIVRAGIPVVGHIGLTPQTAGSLGGFKVQGSTTDAVAGLLEDAKALEAAGVIGIVVECVSVAAGQALRQAVKVPVMGIGAGPHVDAQVLVTQDLLGMYGDFKPKFVKRFADIRKDMISGLNCFHEETIDGTFPSAEYCYERNVEIPKLY